jgi:hypothetical protein
MATNKYFNNFAYAREQDLLEDLAIESIKIFGHNFKYIPRTIIERDDLYGESVLSKFDSAADLEMYVKNTEGFDGDGDFLAKFGLEIRDSMTLTVARKRYDQIRTEKTMTEVGFNITLEDGDNNAPSRRYLTGNHETESLELEAATADGYSITTNRPTEGDLIYMPLMDKLFEIKFVEHEDLFYQTGRLQTYDLRCELFEYSSERLDTGVTEIDSIEDELSQDILFNEFLLEDGTKWKSEDGGSVMLEYTVETNDAQANNSYFNYEADSVIDFSEANPFSEVDRY